MPSDGLYVNNGIINKRVSKEELELYLQEGWIRGMKPRTAEQREAANKKREETCLRKYGVKNVHQLEQVKEKAKDTCIIKYGVDNPAKNEEIKEKTKLTNQTLWPNNVNYHNLDKGKQTLIEKYGSLENFHKIRTANTDYASMVKHQIETKRKNQTFNRSKPEEELYNELCQQYGKENVERNYKDEERYPFFCDFYIKSLDLFIELNRHWTHGGHTFNPNDEKDISKLKDWEEKAKTSKYMEYAIYNWTVRDPLKLKTAIENGLNYKIIW